MQIGPIRWWRTLLPGSGPRHELARVVPEYRSIGVEYESFLELGIYRALDSHEIAYLAARNQGSALPLCSKSRQQISILRQL